MTLTRYTENDATLRFDITFKQGPLRAIERIKDQKKKELRHL